LKVCKEEAKLFQAIEKVLFKYGSAQSYNILQGFCPYTFLLIGAAAVISIENNPFRY